MASNFSVKFRKGGHPSLNHRKETNCFKKDQSLNDYKLQLNNCAIGYGQTAWLTALRANKILNKGD